jgi:hypothetical protein
MYGTPITIGAAAQLQPLPIWQVGQLDQTTLVAQMQHPVASQRSFIA